MFVQDNYIEKYQRDKTAFASLDQFATTKIQETGIDSELHALNTDNNRLKLAVACDILESLIDSTNHMYRLILFFFCFFFVCVYTAYFFLLFDWCHF